MKTTLRISIASAPSPNGHVSDRIVDIATANSAAPNRTPLSSPALDDAQDSSRRDKGHLGRLEKQGSAPVRAENIVRKSDRLTLTVANGQSKTLSAFSTRYRTINARHDVPVC